MSKENYVYVILDPTNEGDFTYGNLKFDYQPFYIGRGIKDRLSTTKIISRSNAYKKNKLISLKNKGVDPILLILESNLTFEESIEREIILIKQIGRKDKGIGPLTNLTDGGDGRTNGKNSPESIEKARVKLKDVAIKRKMDGTDKHTDVIVNKLREINMGEKNPMWGKTHTDEIKEAHSQRISGVNHPMFGKKHNESTKELIRESRAKSVDQELFNKLSKERNSKSILQFSLDGEFIKEHESIKLASQNTGLSESLIGKTCRGVVKNPRKFIFKFKNEGDKILTNSFLIKVGDIHDEYKLVKRNKKSVIVENLNQEILTLRQKEYPIFWEKNKL
jgi:hypothetical protein